MINVKNSLRDALWKNNSALVQLLGLCPLLAVTSTLINGLSLGLATTLVLIITSSAVSLSRHWISPEIRIPIYVMIISSVVSGVHMVVQAYFPSLSYSLGIFIPLIATNCIVIGRAEIIASKNKLSLAALDGAAIGIGATGAMAALGGIREIIGNGTLLSGADQLFGSAAASWQVSLISLNHPMLVAILPPGAFICLGLLLALKSLIDKRMEESRKKMEQVEQPLPISSETEKVL